MKKCSTEMKEWEVVREDRNEEVLNRDEGMGSSQGTDL
jgi:hypothetical protein